MAEEKKIPAPKKSRFSAKDIFIGLLGLVGLADEANALENKAIGCFVGLVALIIGCCLGSFGCYLTMVFSAMGGG